MLGILDKGCLTLGDNTKVDFKNTVIFFTSNLGVGDLKKSNCPMGLAPSLGTKPEDVSLKTARRSFSAEFMNRLDEVITFNSLGTEDIDKIFDINVAHLKKSLFQNGGIGFDFEFKLSDKARKHLIKLGTSVEYGAREMNRVLQREIVFKLAQCVLSEKKLLNEFLKIDLDANDKLTFSSPKIKKTVAAGIGE